MPALNPEPHPKARKLNVPRRYLNAVQTTAQHLLRYLAAAVVVNKRRRNLLKDLVKVGCPEA